MIPYVILLAGTLCCGLASTTLLDSLFFNVHAQVIELPPVLPPPEEQEQPPGSNGTDSSGTGQVPGNFTSPPPTEPPENRTSTDPQIEFSIVSTDPCLEYDDETGAVRILCDASIYQLFAGLRDDSITQQLGSGQILINANITVEDGATFTIDSDGGIGYVKIADGIGITVLGSIHIDGVRLTSWNSTTGSVIDQDEEGSVKRAYLLLSGSEGSRIYNSELGYMGYNATGYRGVDLLGNSSDLYIVNSTFHHMWYGFYSNGGHNITIASSSYHDNHQYAVDPHTSTYNMTIANNTIYNNPVGLVCSLDCYDITFEGNNVYNNSGAGIFFSRNTHDSVARNNIIYDQPIGIAFSESSNNLVHDNKIMSVGRGIFLNNPEVLDDGDTTGNRIYNNTISDSAVGIAALRTADNIAANNFFQNITMSHFRLDSNSSLIIANQTFDNIVIEGLAGENMVIFANSSNIMIDADAYDASMQHTIALSNQTVTVNTVPRK